MRLSRLMAAVLAASYEIFTECRPAVRVVLTVAAPQVSQLARLARVRVPMAVPSTEMVRVADPPVALA